VAAPKISFDLPDDLKLAIADAVTSFAKLEMATEKLIWTLVGVSWSHGRMLTRMDTQPKFALLKKLVLELVPARDRKTIAPNIWRALDELREDRNDIVHAVWAIMDDSHGSHPIVVSHRYSAPPDEIGSKPYSIDLLKGFVRRTEMPQQRFARHLVQLLRSSPAKSE
jgi:hypothetical protein